jgi:hypothetical protein
MSGRAATAALSSAIRAFIGRPSSESVVMINASSLLSL